MKHVLPHGLALSTNRAAAAVAFDEALEEILCARGDGLAQMRIAAAADPSFVLPALTLAGENPRDGAAAQQRIDTLETPWERSHAVLAVEQASGPTEAWADRAIAHMRRFPGDRWMFERVHAWTFFHGTKAQRDQLATLVTTAAARLDFDPYYRMRAAFVRIERGEAEAGLAAVTELTQRERTNVAAWHVRAHALHGLGRHEDVARLCDQLGAESGKFASHLAWHRALVELGRGDFAASRGTFTDSVGPDANAGPLTLILADVNGFVWAHLLLTRELPLPRATLLRLLERSGALPRGGFVDLQRVLLAAALDIEVGSDDDDRPLARLGRAVAEGSWEAAVDILVPVVGAWSTAIGGSRLQRAVLGLVLLYALDHLGRPGDGHELLRRFLPLCVGHPAAQHWLRRHSEI